MGRLDGILWEKLQTPAATGDSSLSSAWTCFSSFTEFWRKRAYNVFLDHAHSRLHLGSPSRKSYLLVIPIVSKIPWRNALDLYAQASTLNFIIACIVAFGTDHLFRMLKTRIATAHLRALPPIST